VTRNAGGTMVLSNYLGRDPGAATPVLKAANISDFGRYILWYRPKIWQIPLLYDLADKNMVFLFKT
jgi:hypothetical protein